MKTTLIFVYNADSGLFNSLADLAHKIFSPRTYSCNLCAITYSSFGMRKQWKQFLDRLDCEKEFLHADELKQEYGIEAIPLPVVMKKEGRRIEVLIDAGTINRSKDIEELKEAIEKKLINERG